MTEERLEALVSQVLKGAKYRSVVPALVRRIGAQELGKRGSLKAAVKTTKKKLHQVGGAYWHSPLDYAQGLALLRESAESPQKFRAACQSLMQAHTSTRERLPILDDFYAMILADLPPIRSVLDVACGLNPLACPWLQLPPEAHYLAVDIFADLLEFVQEFFMIAGINGRTQLCDVVGDPPTEPADLILLLKTLPCLEQIDKQAPTRLLDSLNGRFFLISYPVHSLGGRRKGMVENYSGQFEDLASGRSWRIKRFEFATELAFLIEP